MRKLSAIVLSLVFLMYHLGYYGVYLTTLYQLDKSWADKIEQDLLSSKELLRASLPISLPYRPDQSQFQAASGTVEIDGKYFRIVKQKYAKDTLHILYAPDSTLEGLQESFEDWMASITQKPASQKGNHTFWKSVSKDFLMVYSTFRAAYVTENHLTHNGIYIYSSYEVFINLLSPPPEA